MNQQNSKSTTPSNHHVKVNKSLFIGGIVVLLIAISPILFYSYKSFPSESQVWETSFFKLSTGFPNWNAYAWYLTGKVVPLYFLLIWFFTCKHWWHWIILVPIAMYSFQLWGIINESGGYDEVELIYLLPLMMIIVPAVYLIRAKLFAKIRGNDLSTFEEELGTKRTFWGQIKDLFR